MNRRPSRSPLFTPRRVLALLAAVACGWAGYALYGAAAADRALAARVSQLQAGDAALSQQIAQRSLQIQEAQGSEWVEEQARKLGFHLPGETIYVVLPSGSQVPGSSTHGGPPPTFGVPTPTPTPTPDPTPTPTPIPAATPGA